jgi:hypothetical protein
MEFEKVSKRKTTNLITEKERQNISMNTFLMLLHDGVPHPRYLRPKLHTAPSFHHA